MDWTILATVGEPAAIAITSKGLLVPDCGGWSVDWWVRAEDRWHHASEEVAVRQRLADSGVAVETAMRVPGGDIVQRVWVCVAPGGRGPVAVVEVSNESAVPVALGIAIRPHDLRGSTSLRAALDGSTITCDQRVAVQLPGEPADSFSSHREAGDLAAIFALPHTASLHYAVPLRAAATGVSDLGGLPDSEAVARGWGAQFQAATRLEVPDARMQRVFDAARRRVLGACSGSVHTFAAIDRPVTEFDIAVVAAALAGVGHGGQAMALLDSFGWREIPEVEGGSGDLEKLLATASPTGAVATGLPDGTGDDLAAAAQVLTGVRGLVLDDLGGGHLAFLPQLRDGWEGQSVEIHDAPCSAGLASVALRWHGPRPALLWSVQGEGPLRLTAPGLDPGFETPDQVGEALLAEVGQRQA